MPGPGSQWEKHCDEGSPGEPLGTEGVRDSLVGRRDTGAERLARMGGRAHQGEHGRGMEVRPS